MMPTQKPGRSRQDYGTPRVFLEAVHQRLGAPLVWDLAATDANAVVPGGRHFTEADDALIQPWHRHPGWLWLNPPYARIAPWVQKAYEESLLGARVVVLVPASTGANWWRDWVYRKAHILFLNGRLTFVGTTDPYPKDCALLVYEPCRFTCPGDAIWTWMEALR
jgi:phage N-6-adenine-methyltransferase